MWILYALLFLGGGLAVSRYHSVTERLHALRIYATDLLLRPELHRANAAELRELMLRLANDPRAADKEVQRAIQQWALETRGRAS
jgi:hypothetical protein